MSVIKNLYKNYGDFVLDIPEWHILDTGVTALSGASGSGKTSVFRHLIGLEDCESLSWVYKDVDIAKLSVPERRLGVVFQNYELYPHMTAKENIVFAAQARNIAEEERDTTLSRLVKTLQLEKCLNTKASKLSGGEKQRVALARALIGQPCWLLLDEPFSALDEGLRSEARLLVKSAVEAFNIPTLLVSHDERDVQLLAQSVARIQGGRLMNTTSVG